MSRMIALFFLAIWTTLSVPATGNDVPTTVRLIEKDSVWLLNMDLPSEVIEATMAAYLDEGLRRELSNDEYKREILEYVKTHCRLIVDGRLTPIEQLGLQSNESTATANFSIPEMPRRPRLVEARITMFSEYEGQKNVLAINRLETPLKRFSLSSDNDFRVRVAFTNGDLVETAESRSLGLRGLSFYALVFMGLGAIFWILTKTLWMPAGSKV